MSEVSPKLTVIEGGLRPLRTGQAEALRVVGGLVRGLSDEEAWNLVGLIHQLREDGYLGRMQPYELPVVKIIAEVINGWDEDGVYELARSWASNLVSRTDGFDWDSSTPEEQDVHWLRVREELRRRGLAQATLG